MSGPYILQPVSVRERIVALDVLRGFAMIGVLVAYCMWNLGTAPEESWSPLDKTIDAAASFAVDGKFYTILAFLFGLGFSIQLRRASNDAAAVEVYCYRLAALAGIGLLHALLLRNGDILLPYALTGFLLIPFRRASDRTLIASAIAILLFTAAVRAFWPALGLSVVQRPQLEDAPYLVENAAWVSYWYATAPFSWPTNLTLFLFGYCAGRRGTLTTLANQRKTLVVLLAAGILAGTMFHFARISLLDSAQVSPVLGSGAWLLYTFHCWAMSSAYAAALLLILRTRSGPAALSSLSAIGRLALTNYLLQAALIVPVCLALDLFDQVTPTIALLLAAAVLAVQVPFSLFWSRHFQFGPAEWIWRLLTYQRIPQLRLAPADARASSGGQS